MKRKAVQLGKATLVMSLPAKWIREQGISAGDELEVDQNNSKLIISTQKHKFEPLRTTVEIKNTEKPRGDDSEPFITTFNERLLIARYIKGYDEITILGDTTKLYDVINRRVKNLIGMEIVSQTENMFLIRDLGISSEQPFDQIIRRCFLMIRTMLEDVLKTKGNTDAGSMHDRDQTVNRFVYLLLRKLNKELRHPSGNINIETIPHRYSEVLLIEHISDDVARLGKSLANYKIKNEKILKLIEDLKDMIEMLSVNYFKYNEEKARKVFDYKIEIRARVNKISEETKNKRLINVLYWIREVAETAPDLLESILARTS
ncbi:MAG: hypothetical protein GTN36_01040 [Candidatus Aenigmarchaeota archaeon]|nr:hypothetical protein [Candidatus Aenigmarchaeota archaeon]